MSAGSKRPQVVNAGYRDNFFQRDDPRNRKIIFQDEIFLQPSQTMGAILKQATVIAR